MMYWFLIRMYPRNICGSINVAALTQRNWTIFERMDWKRYEPSSRWITMRRRKAPTGWICKRCRSPPRRCMTMRRRGIRARRLSWWDTATAAEWRHIWPASAIAAGWYCSPGIGRARIEKITMPHLFDHLLVLWAFKIFAWLLIHEDVFILNAHLMQGYHLTLFVLIDTGNTHISINCHVDFSFLTWVGMRL